MSVASLTDISDHEVPAVLRAEDGLPSATVIGDTLVFFDPAGERLDHELTSYSELALFEGISQLYTGVVLEENGQAEVIAVTDAVPVALLGIIGVACAAIYAPQI